MEGNISKRIRKLETRKIGIGDIKKSFNLFRRFNKYILHYWRFELIILILGNFSIVLSLINPYIGKNLLDKGILAKDIRMFFIFTLSGTGIYLINLIIYNFHRYFKNYLLRKVRIDLTKDILKKIRNYSLKFFQDRATGSYIFRLSQDVTDASNIIHDTLPNVIMNVFKLAAITAIVIFINWKILILIIGYQFLVLLQINLFINRMRELIIANLEKSENIFKQLSAIFSHIYIVKAFGSVARETRRYFHDLIERIRIEIKNTKLSIISDLLSNISDKLFFGTITIYGSILVIKGQITLGSLSALMIYITQGIEAYKIFLTSGQQIVLNHILLERVTALFDVETEIKEDDNAKNIIFSKGDIIFKNVVFGYEKNKHVLDNMSFCVPPCARIAIVGSSGCGKTTILNLILRLYDVNKGNIVVDDYDIRSIRFKSIYDQIAIVPQEHYLWDTSIRENIAYGKEDASEDEIRTASQIARIYDFIKCLPRSFDTLVGEDACWISQGQKQRIAIARAIIKRPKILMIDESMSSLDSETEDRIMDNIVKEFKDSTIIVVSHRLSTVKKMDLVYFLESPSNMEVGIHQELIERSPKYKELFASQIEDSADIFNGEIKKARAFQK
jgi:ABC-type multidrug transport system fused ATPase/permease subunit